MVGGLLVLQQITFNMIAPKVMPCASSIRLCALDFGALGSVMMEIHWSDTGPEAVSRVRPKRKQKGGEIPALASCFTLGN